jgi:hypothetical protein
VNEHERLMLTAIAEANRQRILAHMMLDEADAIEHAHNTCGSITAETLAAMNTIKRRYVINAMERFKKAYEEAYDAATALDRIIGASDSDLKA